MGVRIATGLSTAGDAGAGAAEAAAQALAGLDGRGCDLAVVFASGGHLAAPSRTLEQIHAVLRPDQLVGCGAAGVLGRGREIEAGTAVSVWAASLGDGSATAFHTTVERVGEGGGALAGMPDLEGATGVILLADPMSYPTDPVLRFLSEQVPGVPLLGGIASARGADGSCVLFFDEDVVSEGAVGVRFDDVEMLPCVSQGATPIGPELTITAAEGNLIQELAGVPALDKLREILEHLSPREIALLRGASGGLLMGIVIDPGKPEYVQGDFLVRGLVGTDQDSGAVAVGAQVRPGQVIRLHARDARSAHRDLQDALELRRSALGGEPPAGALVFSCNGRGRGMFGRADHDAELVASELGGAPHAGFFCAGEIGPVGGETFLHTFTATLAVFPASA